MAVTLVTASFLRPQAVRQLFFELKLPSWKLAGDEGKSNAEIVTQTNQAVVTIIAMRAVTNVTASQTSNSAGSTGDGRSQSETSVQRGTGSGFFIDAAGFIITNEHVIRNADRIRVRLADGREYKATVQGADIATDIALLKIDAENLSVLALADSDVLRVGDPVIAIGNPLEYEHSVTAGIISAKGRKVYGEQPFEDFIQTDAAINRGNSGGALVNTNGELIGINSQILSPTGGSIGIGFAIPSNMAKDVMGQLVKNGKVRRGQLGVQIQQVTSDIAA
ncbi:MAG: trypsin-like peptidase domain-containing protein, partial [Acidobacteriota bacterium]|nr:trypsin-like peptidase domain-containing protein [Acidobacteriota bacterium]